MGDHRHVIVEDEALRDGFTQIPNAILRHPKLTIGAKLTYGLLLSYAWAKDHAYPGQDRLAADMASTERSVRTYLDQLVTAGLVSIKQRGLGMTNVYTLHSLARPENISALDRKQSAPTERKKSSHQERKDLPPKKTQEKNTKSKNNETSPTDEIDLNAPPTTRLKGLSQAEFVEQMKRSGRR